MNDELKCIKCGNVPAKVVTVNADTKTEVVICDNCLQLILPTPREPNDIN